MRIAECLGRTTRRIANVRTLMFGEQRTRGIAFIVYCRWNGQCSFSFVFTCRSMPVKTIFRRNCTFESVSRAKTTGESMSAVVDRSGRLHNVRDRNRQDGKWTYAVWWRLWCDLDSVRNETDVSPGPRIPTRVVRSADGNRCVIFYRHTSWPKVVYFFNNTAMTNDNFLSLTKKSRSSWSAKWGQEAAGRISRDRIAKRPIRVHAYVGVYARYTYNFPRWFACKSLCVRDFL